MYGHATYKQIKEWVLWNYGFTPRNGQIAFVKEALGLPVRRAANRKGENRTERIRTLYEFSAIEDAIRHFGIWKYRILR